MSRRAVLQVVVILAVGLALAYGLATRLRPDPAAGDSARETGATTRFDPDDFRRGAAVMALAAGDFDELDAIRPQSLIYVAGMNAFFTQHAAAFDAGACQALARHDLGAAASRAAFEVGGWETRPDSDPEMLLTLVGVLSKQTNAVLVTAATAAELRRDGMADGKTIATRYGCGRPVVRDFYTQVVSYVQRRTGSGGDRSVGPAQAVPAVPSAPPGGAGSSTGTPPRQASQAPGASPDPFAQFQQLPSTAAPAAPGAGGGASGGGGAGSPDPFAQFAQMPATPGVPPPSRGGGVPPATFDRRDFQRPDFIEHLHAGNSAALEPLRPAVTLYLTAMNEFFMEQSALFDDGSCTALADPRFGLAAMQSLYRALGWGSVQQPNFEGMFNSLAPHLKGLLEDPGGTLLKTAEIDVLKRQGEMDGKILALRYQCSTPAVRTLYENAKRFIYAP